MADTQERKLARLRESIDWSYDKLKPFREKRHHRLQEFVGFNYSDDGSGLRVPVNTIYLTASILLRNLVAKAPAAACSSPYHEARRRAYMLELGLNYWIEKSRFEDSLRRCVLESLFGIGLMEIGVSEHVDIDGFNSIMGQPFAEVIGMDDLIVDMRAERWDRMKYLGHKFRLPLDDVRDSDFFEHTSDLSPSDRRNLNEGGDERARTLTIGQATFEDDLQDEIELTKIWLPRSNRLLTFPTEQPEHKPISNVRWDGPDQGPFHMLSYITVPDSVMALSPLAAIEDNHLLLNKLWRKLGGQAERQKTIGVVQGSAIEDGERLRNANDGEMIPVNNPAASREVVFGGVDAKTLAFALQIRDVLNWSAGNLEALGGLGQQGETLGQEELIVGSASRTVADMQDRVTDFTRDVLRSVGHWLWQDKFSDIPVTRRVPGTKLEIPGYWKPEHRSGKYYEYKIDIEPYSMQPLNPQQRLRILMQVYQTVIAPNAQALAAEGNPFQVRKFLEMIGRLSGTPDLDELLGIADPKETREDDGPGKPPVTTRQYERIGRPGPKRAGNDQELAKLLLASGQQ